MESSSGADDTKRHSSRLVLIETLQDMYAERIIDLKSAKQFIMTITIPFSTYR